MCEMAVMLFSRSYFKQNFFTKFLCLSQAGNLSHNHKESSGSSWKVTVPVVVVPLVHNLGGPIEKNMIQK